MVLCYGRTSKLKQSPHIFSIRESTVGLSVTNNIFIEFPTFAHLLFSYKFSKAQQSFSMLTHPIEDQGDIEMCSETSPGNKSMLRDSWKNIVGDNEEVRDSSL